MWFIMCDSLLSVPSSFPSFQVQGVAVQMGMFGSLMVHLRPHGFSYSFCTLFHHSVLGVNPCYSHRHLLQPVCTQNTAKTSTGGQKGDEEESGGERKDSQEWESSSEDGGWKTGAEQKERRKDGGKVGES